MDTGAYNTYRSPTDQTALCHAPFKNLRLETMGIVKVCCYSQYFVLGQYPHQSLRDIWFGEKAQSFRKAMMENNISNYGCDLCLNQIKNGEHTNAKPKQFDNLADSQNGYPVILDFSLHNTCNLECVMCQGMSSSSIRKNRDMLPPLPMVYDEKFLAEIDSFISNARQFVFAGGEPFLIEIYYKIWERIALEQRHLTVDIVTNGTIMSGKVKRILKLMPVNISVSIESLQEKAYSLIRKNALLNETLANIQFFSTYCKTQGTLFSLSICPMKINWREVPDMARFANELDAVLYIHTVNSPLDLALWSFPEDELKNIAAYYRNIILPQGNPVTKRNYSAFQDLITQIEAWASRSANHEAVFKQNDEEYIPTLGVVLTIQERFSLENFVLEASLLQQVCIAISEMNLQLPLRVAQEMLASDTITLATMVVAKSPTVLVDDLVRLNKSF